jgi:hypothetical protein
LHKKSQECGKNNNKGLGQVERRNEVKKGCGETGRGVKERKSKAKVDRKGLR